MNGLFELDELEHLWRGEGVTEGNREGRVRVYVCLSGSQYVEGGLCMYIHCVFERD